MEKWKKYWPLAVVVGVIAFLSWISWASAAHITHPGQCVTPAMTDQLVKVQNPDAKFEEEVKITVVTPLGTEAGVEINDVARIYSTRNYAPQVLVVIYRNGCEAGHGLLAPAQVNELLGRRA